jgi:dTDP-N-acetylfucosamine:lipid II N-acetylfucosaminyltransferase
MITKKIRLVHIHTDNKFVKASARYEGLFFENKVILFEDTDTDNKIFLSKNVVCLKNTKTDLTKAIFICNQSDAIIVYGLSTITQNIILALKKEVKIAWRFFGYELYNKIPELILSKSTLSYTGGRFHNRLKYLFLKSPLLLSFFSPSIKKSNDLFYQSLKRVSFFLCYSVEEYRFLRNYFPILPEFLQLPIMALQTNFKFNKSKPENIVVGHSRSAFNNHLEVLDIINKHSGRTKYNYLLLFNYGSVNSYTKRVKEVAHRIPNLTFIEEFIPREEFDNFYDSKAAFVSNSYRQLAIGNVFPALKKGVKVYLNPKNVMYRWLKRDGFLVYTINDFAVDLPAGNVMLSETEAKYNYDNYLELTKKNSIEKYLNELYLHISELKFSEDNLFSTNDNSTIC